MSKIHLSDEKYFKLLSEKYPTAQAVKSEIINLTAILNLPKGTEHFMSDIHGEYEAFCHILNNCSGVIREKINALFGDEVSQEEKNEICTLIYYTKEKLRLIKKENRADDLWYKTTITRLLEIARVLSSKYTRSKVRKAMPEDYAYIIDELLHVQKDEDDNQIVYHKNILNTIIEISADDFVLALAELIKRLAVDHLHIVGDIFDRGESADKVMDLLMKCPSLDIEWGNHDILWMGACAGSEACAANVVRNSIRYNTVHTLENGYGISLRKLVLFAAKTYSGTHVMQNAHRAITIIQFKLEGQLIKRHPEYLMDDRLLLQKIDLENLTAESDGRTYKITDNDFPTLNRENPYELTDEEQSIVDALKDDFTNSIRLNKHVEFLYKRGGMYKRFNGNLLYHGCVPLDSDGNIDSIELFGEKLSGKAYFDAAEQKARHAFSSKHKKQDELDFMWYLWSGRLSPLCGRNIKTFERFFIPDKNAWSEDKNPYYSFYTDEKTCDMIIEEFGLNPASAHIINGHTPVRTTKGELPVKAGGKLIVIDGGFCKAYHETTGIAGYTLIYNSHGLRIKSHKNFESVNKALEKNKDIHSRSEIIETADHRVMVQNTDNGKEIRETIEELRAFLKTYE